MMMMMMSAAAAVIISVVLGACGGDDSRGSNPDEVEGSTGVVQIAEGETLYQQTCAPCHGSDLSGTSTGPPFLDSIYAPDHHPDEAFHAAVENGVEPHHWDFGAMPAQPSLSVDEVEAIIAFVRAKQSEAGIIEDATSR